MLTKRNWKKTHLLNDIYNSLDPVAFTLFGTPVRWYGLAYSAGFIIAAVLIYFTAKRWKVHFPLEDLVTMVLCTCAGLIFGARLGYCLFYGAGHFLQNPLMILNFGMGGMSFHGGAFGAIVGLAIAAKLTKIPFLTLTDLVCIAAPLGLFLGRCANFVNGELWGAPTDLPWGVVFGGAAGNIPRHPSQLYEALLEGLLLFVVLFAMSHKKPPFPRGVYSGTFLVLYSVCRFAIEFVRLPDAQIGYLLGDWFTMGQALTIPLFVLGAFVLMYALTSRLPQGARRGANMRDGAAGASKAKATGEYEQESEAGHGDDHANRD